MRSKGVILGAGGMLVTVLLALAASHTQPAGAQDGSPPPSAQTVPQGPGTTTLPPSPTVHFPVSQPQPRTDSSVTANHSSIVPPSVTPQQPLRERLKSESIDGLLSRLDNIKAQKVELERQEKETIGVLKEKLKEQKQRLQRLGVNVEESRPLPSRVVPEAVPVTAEPPPVR
jgi:hypothetical protein